MEQLARLLVLLCLAAAVVTSHADEKWQKQYVPAEDGLPTEARPPWAVGATSADASVTLDGDALRIDSTANGNSIIRYEQFQGWDSTKPGEIEVTVRVVEQQTPGVPSGQVLISGPHGWQTLALSIDKITLGQRSLPLDLTDYQTFRIRVSGGEFEEDAVTVALGDKRPVLEASWNSPTTDADGKAPESKIAFGDLSTTEGVGGVVDWKAIRWKSAD